MIYAIILLIRFWYIFSIFELKQGYRTHFATIRKPTEVFLHRYMINAVLNLVWFFAANSATDNCEFRFGLLPCEEQ